MALISDKANLKLYRHNKEAQNIWAATQPELDILRERIHEIFDNTRAVTANTRGIDIWERTYNILPNLRSDTFDERQDRVLEWKRTREPFTKTWLNEQLYHRGEGFITAELAGLTLTLRYINDPYAPRRHRELMPWISEIIPANILIHFLSSLPRLYIKPPPKIKAASFLAKPSTIRASPLPRPFMGQITNPQKTKAAAIFTTFPMLISASPTRPPTYP